MCCPAASPRGSPGITRGSSWAICSGSGSRRSGGAGSFSSSARRFKPTDRPAFPAVASFFKSVVLPNFTFFGYMTFVVELALGLGLLLGLLTRLAGIGGFLWQVNIAVGAFNVPGEWYWIWVLLTMPQFCFAVLAAGRVWGLDAILRPWLTRMPPTGWSRLLLLAT